MDARYPLWHSKKGDVNASPDLRDTGKKLLGEIQASVDQGGPPTQVRRRQLPDGSGVEARMTYGLPSLTFAPPNKSGAKKVKPLLLEGFVTTPHAHGVTTPPAGLLQVIVPLPGAAGPKPPGYAGAAEAVAITHPDVTAWFPYYLNKSGQIQFEDGLIEAGNVDWRNTDGTLSVSWFGANSRYFPDEGERSSTVYARGRKLFDLFDPTAEEVPALVGYTGRWVHGAALRGGNRLWLYIACQLITPGGSGTTYDALVRVPVRVDPVAPPWQQRVGPMFAPMIAAVPAQAEVLWTAARSAFDNANDGSSLHSWMFNPSGTEAKRIYRSAAYSDAFPCMVEETLDLRDLTNITRTRTEHRMLRTRTTSVANVVLNPNQAFTYQAEGDPANVNFTGVHGAGGVNYNYIADYCGVAHAESTATETAVLVPIAVDYKGATPVYAYWKSGERNLSAMMDWVDTSPPPSISHTAYTDASNYTWESNHSIAGSFTSSLSDTVLAGRLVLPNAVIEAQSGYNINIERSYSYTQTLTATRTSASYSRTGTLNTDQQTDAFSQVRTQTYLAPMYLDLRTEYCVVAKYTLTTTRIGTPFRTATLTQYNDPVLGWTWQEQSSSLNTNVSRTKSLQVETTVLRGAEVLHTATAQTTAAATSESAFGSATLGLFALGHDFYPVERIRENLLFDGTPLTFMDASTPYEWSASDISYPLSMLDVYNPDSIPPYYELPNQSTTFAMTNGFLLPASPINLPEFASQVGAAVEWLYEEPWHSRPDMRSYGSWASYRASYIASMPWPSGNISTPNYLNVVDGYQLFAATGQDTTGFSPVWTLTQVAYLGL